MVLEEEGVREWIEETFSHFFEYLGSSMDLIQISFRSLLIEHGFPVFLTTQFLSGMGLLFFVPDALVSPTFTAIYAESILDVLMISISSALSLVCGSILLYLFSRTLGDRFISEERKQSRVWRITEKLLKKNSKISLVLLNLFPVGNGLVAVPAGLFKIKIRTFILYSLIGFLIFELGINFGIWYGLETGYLNNYF